MWHRFCVTPLTSPPFHSRENLQMQMSTVITKVAPLYSCFLFKGTQRCIIFWQCHPWRLCSSPGADMRNRQSWEVGQVRIRYRGQELHSADASKRLSDINTEARNASQNFGYHQDRELARLKDSQHPPPPKKKFQGNYIKKKKKGWRIPISF